MTFLINFIWAIRKKFWLRLQCFTHEMPTYWYSGNIYLLFPYACLFLYFPDLEPGQTIDDGVHSTVAHLSKQAVRIHRKGFSAYSSLSKIFGRFDGMHYVTFAQSVRAYFQKLSFFYRLLETMPYLHSFEINTDILLAKYKEQYRC